MDSTENQESRVFIGNIAPDTDPDLIEQHFKTHGNVSGVAVHKGYCFVQYEQPSEAKIAIEKENGSMFLGKRIDVKHAKRGSKDTNKNNEDTSKGNQHYEQDQQQQSHDDYQGYGRHQQDYDQQESWHPRGGRGGRGRGRGRGRGGGYYDDYNPRGRGGRGGSRGGRGGGRGGYQDYNYDNHDYYNNQSQQPQQSQPVNNDPPKPTNDCEIVCVSRNQRQYAERIESRLKMIGLKVDVLFPNPKVDLAKIFSNITARGVTFAILITPLNEDHNSVTLNILQGQQQEHRNMPLEDAVNMIAQLFEQGLDKANQAQDQTGFGQGGKGSRMPEDVRNVFGFLMDSRPLSVMEYDKLIKYLVKQREDMLKSEYGDNIPANLITPPIGPPLDTATKAKQDELQSKIMDILNKQKEPVKPAVPELSASLQKAIDSLIKSGPNLLSAPSSSAMPPMQQTYSQASSGDYYGGQRY